jgi:hypothetical protein
MTKTTWTLLRSLAATLAILSVADCQAEAADQDRDARVREWLDKFHDPHARFVVFPDGQIFTARAKWTGVATGRLNLWHCFSYMPLK